MDELKYKNFHLFFASSKLVKVTATAEITLYILRDRIVTALWCRLKKIKFRILFTFCCAAWVIALQASNDIYREYAFGPVGMNNFLRDRLFSSRLVSLNCDRDRSWPSNAKNRPVKQSKRESLARLGHSRFSCLIHFEMRQTKMCLLV